MQLENWGRGRRFVKAREGLAIWIKRQQEMEANKAAKNDNFKMKFPALNVDKIRKELDEAKKKRVWDFDICDYVIDGEDPKHPLTSGRSYGQYLRKKGYETIGSGAYSTVYKHPKDTKGRCIKVSRRMDPWFEYIHWAYENGHTEYCPGVHSYKYHPGLAVNEDKRVSFYVAIVDELTTKDSGEHEMTGYFFNQLMHSKPSEKTKLLAELNSPGFVAFTEAFSKRFHRGEDGKRQGYSLDCYGGANTMLSQDGKRWVLNDPLCGNPQNYNIVQTRWRNESRRGSSVRQLRSSAANDNLVLRPNEPHCEVHRSGLPAAA